jgi:hypothetical protein
VSVFAVRSAALGVLSALCLATSLPAAAEDIEVVLDQARILRLPDRVTTLVIGNPAVADGTLQTGGLLVVTGKNYGATNLIALDSRGEVLVQHNITVAAPKDGRLTVWRGVERESWSCAPRCERATVLGDAPDFFESASRQAEARNGQAIGQPAAAAPR